VEIMDAGGPQVCDDMTVEVALAVMAAARTGRLVVCDVLGDHAPLASLMTPDAEAGHAMRSLRLGAAPVTGGRGGAPALVAHSR
jgi:CBS domain-containing protein